MKLGPTGIQWYWKASNPQKPPHDLTHFGACLYNHTGDKSPCSIFTFDGLLEHNSVIHSYVDILFAFWEDLLLPLAFQIRQFLDSFTDDLKCSLNLIFCDD